jgi:hypothetical protein
MPLLTRWVIKTSFVYLGMALVIGIFLAGQSLWHLPVFIATLFPDYIHLLVVGWLTLLIFGVAYWMFPKYSLEHPHGSEALNGSAYLLLNMGLVIRIVIEPVLARSQGTLLGWLLVLSALLQWLGGMALLITLWKRVKER